jgi:GT2 family glycosyltransferase
MSQRSTLDRPGTPYVQTANCAVRRSAFAAVGGFDEAARSGEDADLCFRLLAAGWSIEERPQAVVEHPTRATLGELVRQLAVHGSGVAWLDRRYPGEFPAPRPGALCRRVMRAGSDAALAGWRRDWEAAQAGVVELASDLAFELGRRRSNQARRS